MNVQEAIDYCYLHRDEYISDAYANQGNGHEEFECLVSCLESGHILPEDLAEYGMDYN